VPFEAASSGWYAQAELYAEAHRPVQEILAPTWEQRRVASSAGAGQSLLDIGCGGGIFLALAGNKGLRATGLDIQNRQLQWAAEVASDAELHQTTLEEFARAWPERRFDVVTAFHVLEHLQDPIPFLCTAAERLNPGGRLAVAVPNRDRMRLDPRVDEVDVPPHHVTFWSTGALSFALGTVGLEQVEVEISPVETFGPLTRLFSSGLLARAVRPPANCSGCGDARAPSGESAMPLTSAIRLYRVKLAALRELARIPDFVLSQLGGQGAVLLGTGRRSAARL
jgi:SAM-dependent methyltransferase